MPQAERDAAAMRTLHGLIQLCRDSEALYRTVAERVPGPSAAAVLRDIAAARREDIETLKSIAAEAGGRRTEGRTVWGAMRQARIVIEARVFGDRRVEDWIARLKETEKRALDGFRAATAQPLPAEMRPAVEAQIGRLETALAGLDALSRDTTPAES